MIPHMIPLRPAGSPSVSGDIRRMPISAGRIISVFFPDDNDCADQEQEEKDCADDAEY